MLRKWLKRLDPRYLRPCVYVAVTAILTFATGMVVWNAWGFLGTLWDVIKLAFQPIVYGAIISYLLQPSVRFFSQLLARRDRTETHQRRRTHIAVALTLGSLAIVVLAVIALALLMVTRSLGGFSMESLQELLTGAKGGAADFAGFIADKLSSLGVQASDATTLMSLVGDASEIFTIIMLSVVVGAYFLFDGENAALYGKRLMHAILGEHNAERAAAFFGDADRIFSEYVRGQFVDALIVGLMMSVGLSIAGVPYGMLIGITAGVANLIPFTGGIVGYVLVAIACLPEGNMPQLIAGIVVVTIVMGIDGNFVSPRLIGKTLTFHPMLVLVALVLGSTIGGVPGMIVAVPLFAFLKLKLDEWIDERLAESGEEAAEWAQGESDEDRGDEDRGDEDRGDGGPIA